MDVGQSVITLLILLAAIFVVGAVVVAVQSQVNRPSDEFEDDDLTTVLLDRPPTVSRTYFGTADEVQWLRSDDARELAAARYYPVSEAYTPGNHSTGTWMTAVFLILLFGFGLLVIIYLIAKRPPGYLTVIYERRLSTKVPSNEIATAPDVSVRVALAQLDSLRGDGLLTDAEYTAKRAEILARL